MSRNWPIVLLFTGLIIAYGLWLDSRLQEKRTAPLKVLAYSSFISSWGPGPTLVSHFERTCSCKVEMTEGDSSQFLQKLKNETFDVVIGLDATQLQQAEQEIPWLEVTPKQKWVIFDWAPLGFIYNKKKINKPPRNLDDLLNARWRNAIALQDPRTSSIGLQFASWIQKEKNADFLKSLKPNIHSISPSWSTAYALFKTGQADIVFSYQTSAVYHWIEEKDQNFQVIPLNTTAPLQIEVAAIPQSCQKCSLAKEFILFLLTDESQTLIMKKNYMLPIKEALVEKTPFEIFKNFYSGLNLKNFPSIERQETLKFWTTALSI